jgi:phosphatidylinositol alpha-1,6-mannosyltransferase
MAGHLLVTNDFPPKTGGIQVYLHELWSRLEPGRAVVLTASSHADATAFDATSGVVTERVAASTLFLPTLANLRAIESAIDRHRPDLVLFDPAWPLGLLGPHLSRPYGVILHGAEVAVPGRVPFVASSLRYVLRHAQVAICAGGYAEREARRNAADDMPAVLQIPPGVDTTRFAPLDASRRGDVRRSMGLAEEGLLVSSYSRLVPRKGMDTLIRASALLRRDIPTLSVAIGGAGRDRARLEKVAMSAHAPVTFLGRVPDAQLAPWLAAGDLMVLDCRSRWLGLEQEGFGIVFLEAASSGVTQIAGRSGGSYEPVLDGVTGIVLENARSVKSLANAMGELLGDAERRRRYGDASRSLALEKFEWGVLATRLGNALAPFDHFGANNRLA